MISAALLRAGIGVGAKVFGRQLATEAVQSSVSTAIGKAVSGRVMNFAAGRAGQEALTKVGGNKVAQLATTRAGQSLGKRLVTRDISSRIQGEGQFGPNTKEVKGAPRMVTQPAPLDPNNMMINPPQTAPTVSIADKPPDPGKWGTGDSVDVNDRPKTGREMARDWQQARQGRKKQPYTGGAGWMGTGKGWWQQNEQVSGAGANRAIKEGVGDFSVAQGPSKWAMPEAWSHCLPTVEGRWEEGSPQMLGILHPRQSLTPR